MKPPPPKSKPAASTSPEQVPTLARRWELLILLVVLLLGNTLRLALPSHLGVEHFDEGVYASNYWFGPEQHHQYPGQELYAPPLLPALIEWICILFGPSNVGPAVPSLVAGCLSLVLVWWVGREWFGPLAGLTAAILAAGSDVHILFSRAALTDVLLSFWLLAAVYAFTQAMTKAKPRWALAAGLLTGLAWWTKYNGWLPIAISLAGGLATCLAGRWWGRGRETPSPREARSPSRTTSSSNPTGDNPKGNVQPNPMTGAAGPPSVWKRCLPGLLCWGGAVGIAVVVWLPYLWDLQSRGGYGPIARNHSGYLVGVEGWLASLIQYIRKLQQLNSWPTLLSLAVVALLLLCSLARVRRFTWNRIEWVLFLALALIMSLGVGAFLGGSPLVAIVAMYGVAYAVYYALTGRMSPLPVWCLAAWFCGLALVTPLYTPYPRLTLPWHLAAWLACGAFVRCVVDNAIATRDSEPSVTSRQTWRHYVLYAFATTCMGSVFYPVVAAVSARDVPGWQSHRELVPVAHKIVADAFARSGLPEGSTDPLAIYVYGEPALLFQLRLAGAEHVAPVMHLGFARPEAPAPRLPSFVVVGPHAAQTAGFAEQFQQGSKRLHLVGKYDCVPSLLVQLDGNVASGQPAAVPPKWRFILFRVEP